MKAHTVLHLGPKLEDLPVREYQFQVNKLKERNAGVFPADVTGSISIRKCHLHAAPTGDYRARERRDREERRRHWMAADAAMKVQPLNLYLSFGPA